MNRAQHSAVAGTAILLVAGYSNATHAQSVADFYRGKTLTMLVGTAPGGEYDLLARLVAKYIGRRIPGAPTVIVQNMAGASGMKVANFMFSPIDMDDPTPFKRLAIRNGPSATRPANPWHPSPNQDGAKRS